MSSPSSPSPSAIASVIDSVVHGQNAVLSFRNLSTIATISLLEAQSHLYKYASNSKNDITVLWHVTTTNDSVTKTTLTANPPSTVTKKKVWAVAPSNMSTTNPSVWLSPDREIALEQAAQPSNIANALRDGRFLPIASSTAGWDTRPDPRFAGGAVSSGRAVKKAGGLLGAVKQTQKRSIQKHGNGSAKKAPSFKKMSNGNSASTKSKLKENGHGHANGNGNSNLSGGGGQKSSLFSSKRLGQNAADKIKQKQKVQDDTKTTSKKSRRVISIDDDDDDNHDVEEKKKDVFEDDDDDDNDSVMEMERKAMEREGERTEEERAEIERELKDLSNEDIGDEQQPESPEIKDVDDEAEAEKEVEIEVENTVKEGVKRSFRETFGLPEQSKGSRRIRKEVAITEEGEDGYLITRRVMKTFDENGNEVEVEVDDNDNDTEDVEKEKKREKVGNKSGTTSCLPGRTQGSGSNKKNCAMNGNGTKKSEKSEKSEKSGIGKKSKSGQKSGGTIKPKKKKGNIMSYFAKKT